MDKKDFVNIASYLPEMAVKIPDEPAVIVQGKGYTKYTFKELDEKSNAIANGLEAIGIRKGMRTVLMVKPSLEFFSLTFALFKVGAIPVMIDPGIGIKNLGKCLEEAEPKAFIGVPKAHIARILRGWGRKTIKILVTVGRKAGWGGSTLKDIFRSGDYKMAQTQPDDIAAVLFTSGSTGIPKGAVYTHSIFDNQVKFLRSVYGISPGEKDLATFPLFALFGPALGMASIIPDMDASRPAQADPSKIIKAIKDFNATNMFASPALINKVGRFGVKNNIKLDSIKRVISAGAPARPDALERFSKMLNPGVEIFTPYGATEALPVSNIGSSEILMETRKLTDKGKGNCVGFSNPGVDLKIIKITDSPIESWSDELVLPAGEIGEIVVKGPIVSGEYYNRPKANALAKIADKNGGFYHRMGDVGYKDEKGSVWFCGRKSHRVKTSEGTFFTIPTEAVFNVHPKVFRTAIVGVKGKPVLCVELEKNVSADEKNKIKKELIAIGANYPHTSKIKTILFHSKFPVDIRHNAKIFREKLTVWARGKLS
ncbi:AMP-binding protein [Candidatus Woesearchaeota archaeon]|nr:AMP-binding protein [Candidatus Woesearchaeota archaeon]